MTAPARVTRPEAPQEATDPVGPPSRRSRPAGGGRDWPLHVLTAVVTSALTAWSLRLWEATWSVPMVYVGDAVAVQAHAKTVLGTGWYEVQNQLGAPAGQHYHDFPTADNLHMMAFRLLGLVSSDSAVVMNLYYVLGFPLAAVAGLWFLRRCGVSRAVGAALAVLFALSPYHFERHEGHLFLGSYYVVPLALGVVVTALRGEPLWGRRRGSPGPLAFLAGPGALTVVAMAVVGTASSYYAVFIALLLAVAGLLAFARDRRWKDLFGAAGAGVALVATMLANMAPDVLYARGRPPNAVALIRFPEQAEYFGLKAIQLVLPSDRHRFTAFRSVREYYNRTFPLPSESPTLGLVAAVGFTLLLGVVLVALVVPALRAATVLPARAEVADADARVRRSARWTLLVQLSVLNLVAFLAATVGGLSSLIALAVTDNLRGWSRMTILIALLGLAAVGLVADAVVDALRSRWHAASLRAVVAVVPAAAILLVGTVDQTSPLYVPDYSGNAAYYAADGAYVDELEADLPADAMVFQLPYISFPESPTLNGVLYTDQIRMFLHSTDLRWSSGGLKGRPEVDWAESAVARPVPQLVRQLAAAGFAGVHLDGWASADGGAATASELTQELGPPTRTSSDGRYRFWPLAAAVQRLDAELTPVERQALSDAVLLPVVAYTAPDFDGPADQDGSRVWTSRGPRPTISLDSSRQEPVEVRLTFTVRSPTGATSAVVTVGDLPPQVLDLAPDGSVDVTLDVPPGRTVVGVALPDDAAATGVVDEAATRFQVVDLTVDDPVLDRLGG